MAALEEQHLLADRALGYVELYGAYTETEARYRVDRLLALWDRMDADDRASLLPRPGGHRLGHLRPRHPPARRSSSTPGCAPRPAKSTKPNRADRARKAILSPDRHLAAFDLENTLIASNVVDSYAWLASRHLPRRPNGPPSSPTCWPRPPRCWPSTAATGATSSAPSTAATRAPRSTGCATTDGSSSTTCCWPSPFPPGFARVRAHRALGHRTVLITGALDFVVEPLRPLFDDIVCARLGRGRRRFTGRLDELPPIGEARALVLADYAEAEGLQLEESMAYADSASDLPMLEAVGFPVAVNPEAKLAAIARRRGWHVEHWHKADGGQPAPPAPRARSTAGARSGAAAPVRRPWPGRRGGALAGAGRARR